MMVQVAKADQPEIHALLVPWICCFAVASLASCVSLFIRGLLLCQVLRRDRLQYGEEAQAHGSQARLMKYKSRVNDVSKESFEIYTALLIGLLENLPLGVLQAVYASRLRESMGFLSTASYLTSWTMLGVAPAISARSASAWLLSRV